MKGNAMRQTDAEHDQVTVQDTQQADVKIRRGQIRDARQDDREMSENKASNDKRIAPHQGYGLFGEPGVRPGIAGAAYDTAWLAGVPSHEERRLSRFPSSLQWLVMNQHSDGSWGGAIRYEHDRILSTLAAIVPLATFGRRATDRAAVEAGTRYLWQHCHVLGTEPMELVGFELLLPTLIRRAQRAGISVPPNLDIYAAQRAEKLHLIPPAFLYSSRATVSHSLEFLDDEADINGLRSAQGENGAIGNSPAATAFFLAQSDDTKAKDYIDTCLSRTGGATAPVLHPCETFELLWAAYHLFLAGVPANLLLTAGDRATLRNALAGGGVSLSTTFPIPDADDTAVAIILLHELGEPVDVSALQSFASLDGYFVSFPHERHSSVGVNLHVLHALLRVPGYPDAALTIERILGYLIEQQISDLYWLDKWHISPYYATAHALCVLAELGPTQDAGINPLVERSREWLRQSQNSDGSWGFYGRPTAEETAYGILGLAAGGLTRMHENDIERCAVAAKYLRAVLSTATLDDQVFPPLWIDKCLYIPELVVSAAIEAALATCTRLHRNWDVMRRRGNLTHATK